MGFPLGLRFVGPASGSFWGVATTGVDPAASSAVAAPVSYDVAQATEATITSLETSARVEDRLMATVIRNTRASCADYLARGARAIATTSQGNGGFPIVVLVGPNFNPDRPAEVHTHYHGYSSNAVERLGDSGRVQLRLREVQAADPQVVFVLPECRNALYPPLPKLTPSLGLGAIASATAGGAQQTPSYATDWSNVKSQTRTTADALVAAGITRVDSRTVSAHSGGGAAVAYASQSARGLSCDRLELADSFYGSEVAIAAWAATPEGAAAREVIYIHGTNTHDDTEVKRAFGSRYRRTEVPTRRENPIALNADGSPLIINGRPLPRIGSLLNVHTRSNTEYLHTAVRSTSERKSELALFALFNSFRVF